jgi:Cys-rich protein (TIGR01571 family)
MLFFIANLDPGARFDGSHPDRSNHEETPNSYYFCCALDDLFWYSYFAFSVYLLKNVRYVSTIKTSVTATFARLLIISCYFDDCSDVPPLICRAHVRSKYAIPESEQCPRGCEDLCCSLVCPCFTAAQLLRHTTDYDTYDAKCCTETGLPAHAPAIV